MERDEAEFVRKLLNSDEELFGVSVTLLERVQVY